MTGTDSTTASAAENPITPEELIKRFQEMKDLINESLGSQALIKKIIVSKLIIPSNQFWVIEYEGDRYLFIPELMYAKIKEIAKENQVKEEDPQVIGLASLSGIPIVEDEGFVWTVVAKKLGLEKISPMTIKRRLPNLKPVVGSPYENKEADELGKIFDEVVSFDPIDYEMLKNREIKSNSILLTSNHADELPRYLPHLKMFTGLDAGSPIGDYSAVYKPSLRPYMAYSRRLESHDGGAVLVFAHSVREAKKVVWNQSGIIDEITGNDFTDLAVRYLRNSEYLYEEADQAKLVAGIPHVVDDPTYCKNCELWGVGPLGENGICKDCEDGVRDEYDY
jgi:hypothetical protein